MRQSRSERNRVLQENIVMSAIPLRKPQPDVERICILELCNVGNTLDLYSDRLVSLGYEVVSANNYADAVKLVHQCEPALVVVYDDPATNIDAVRWIETQHMDNDPKWAMIPILILADAARVPDLHIQELPDRVVVLQRRADTLNQLTRTVKKLLRIWELD
jgi:hypothetical protein